MMAKIEEKSYWRIRKKARMPAASRLTIPCDMRGASVQLKAIAYSGEWDRKKDYELGRYFGWFLYAHSTAAFVDGLRDFVVAPAEEQFRRPERE